MISDYFVIGGVSRIAILAAWMHHARCCSVRAFVFTTVMVSFAVGHCFPSVTVVLCPVGCVNNYKCCCVTKGSGVGVKP